MGPIEWAALASAMAQEDGSPGPHVLIFYAGWDDVESVRRPALRLGSDLDFRGSDDHFHGNTQTSATADAQAASAKTTLIFSYGEAENPSLRRGFEIE